MPVKVEFFDDIDAVARDAAGALDRASTPSLFDRLDWYRLTLAHCPPPGTPLIVRARDGAAEAWLFLVVEHRTARALASWYSLNFSAIARNGGETLVPAIAAALRRRGIGRVELAPSLDGPELARAFRSAGWWTRLSPASVGWRVRIGERDFSQYWASRPAQLRATARRKAKKTELDFSLFKYFDGDAWNAYEYVYALSWKPPEGSTGFLRALAEAEGAAGTLRLGIARHAGEPVAAQFWLVENGIATIHKLAHVEAARAHSPGTQLSRAMFQAVIDGDRPEWIDFGTGDDGYKADWMEECRTLHRVEAWNPGTPHGLAYAGRAALGSLVRAVRKD